MSGRISYVAQDIDGLPSLKQQNSRLWRYLEVLQARVSSLEAERGIFFDATAISSNGLYHCSALNCNMIFPNHKKLYKHLRSAIGPGHRALRAIINQTDCHACNREFNKPQALAIHEASGHSCEKEGGNRLEKHAPFFGSRELWHKSDLIKTY